MPFVPYQRSKERVARWLHERDDVRLEGTATSPPGTARRVLLRERFLDIRHAVWEQRDLLPDRPFRTRVLAMVATFAVIGGVAVAVRARSTAAPAAAPPAPAQAAPTLRRFYADLASKTPAGSRRLIIAGDRNASALTPPSDRIFEDGRFAGLAYTHYGCGVVAGTKITNHTRVQSDPRCVNWAKSFQTVTSAFDPEVTMLAVGDGETQDWIVDGRVLRVGTADYAAYLGGQLDIARTALTANGARFMLATFPCSTLPDGNRNLRTLWLNQVLRSYAAAHPIDVTIADIDDFLCPNGKITNNLAGEPLMANGSLTHAGAAATWEWFADVVASQLGVRVPTTS